MLYKDTLKLKKVHTSLLPHEKQKKTNYNETQETALIVQGTNKKSRILDGESKTVSSKIKGKDEAQCYKCHEFGHIKRNCPHRKKKNGETNKNTVGYATNEDVFTIPKSMNISSRVG